MRTLPAFIPLLPAPFVHFPEWVPLLIFKFLIMERIHSPKWTEIAEVELVYKTKVKASERPKISSSIDTYDLLVSVWNPDNIELYEQVKVLLLNRANKVLGIYHCSSGGITGASVDLKLVVIAAIKSAACSVVLTHNHPSGNLQPSQADRKLTSELKNILKYLDIRLLDHIIITQEGYYSFADEGVL
ncbi:MAG: JAB domain-containing protein [Chitinophagaceae bacterium]